MQPRVSAPNIYLYSDLRRFNDVGSFYRPVRHVRESTWKGETCHRHSVIAVHMGLGHFLQADQKGGFQRGSINWETLGGSKSGDRVKGPLKANSGLLTYWMVVRTGADQGRIKGV